MAELVEEKLWHKSYRLGSRQLARSLTPYPELPLYTILDHTASRNPSSSAVEYCEKKLSYAELKVQCDSLAAALARLKVKPGDKVVTILPTCPQYIISTFATLITGAAHVPCSMLQKIEELEYEIHESGANTVICLLEHLDSIKSIRPGTKLKNIIVTSIDDYTLAQPDQLKRIKGAYQFRDLIAKYRPRPPKVVINPREDLAYLAFTGGATGRPKGVMLTHYNRLCNVLQGLPWLLSTYEKHLRGTGSVIISVPLFHSYGDWMMLSAIYWGLRIILVRDPRDIDTLLELMIKNRPFLVSIVPTQLMKLREKDIPGMPVQIISGAAYLPDHLRKSFSERTKIPVSEGYGLTEAGPVTHINLAGAFSRQVKHSIGVPVPDTAVKLIDEESGQECAIGEAGHMYIKGPQVMKGYWPNPGNGLVDGWLPTGDIALMDEDGYFYLVDRIKDMVNVSGYKVYPGTVDDILYQHPAVFAAASIGVPDPERGGSERIKAFIQLKEDYKGKISAAEIIEFCKAKCPPYAVPRFVEFREDLPLTATQKLFKRKLREEEAGKPQTQ